MKKADKTEKIGGWLILFTIGLFVITFIWVIMFVLSGIVLFGSTFETFSLVLFILSFLTMSFGIFSLILEFKKKKKFVKFLICTLILNLILTIVVSIKFETYSNIISGILGAIVWIWYFVVSKRVKKTFTK